MHVWGTLLSVVLLANQGGQMSARVGTRGCGYTGTRVRVCLRVRVPTETRIHYLDHNLMIKTFSTGTGTSTSTGTQGNTDTLFRSQFNVKDIFNGCRYTSTRVRVRLRVRVHTGTRIHYFNHKNIFNEYDYTSTRVRVHLRVIRVRVHMYIRLHYCNHNC